MMERKNTRSTMRVATVFFIILLGNADCFGVSKLISSRKASVSPLVKPIPLVPSTRIPSINSPRKVSQGSAEIDKSGGFINRFKFFQEKIRGVCRKPDGKIARRAMLVSVASALVALLGQPTKALAMGAMGGSKGPVAPMQRYVRRTCLMEL